MTDHEKELAELAAEFESCRKILLALGDENRQHLILEMMKMGQCGGVRVGAVTEKTHLSRPAVSHHILSTGRIPPYPDTQRRRSAAGPQRRYKELLLF